MEITALGQIVTTHGQGGQMAGTLLAVARLNPSLRKANLSAASQVAVRKQGLQEHAFCIVQLNPATLSLCSWSIRWPDIFARISVSQSASALEGLQELIARHVEFGALEQLGLWDLDALAETLSKFRRVRPNLYLVDMESEHA